jgi:uncharacterized protein (DUF58 family)
MFSLVLFAMLLGSMNYNNNMGFALTFLLAGLGVAAMHQAHRNLNGLAVRFQSVDPVFAGQNLRYRFRIVAPAQDSRWDLQLAWLDSAGVALDVPAGESTIVDLDHETTRRGKSSAPAVRVRSSFPFGLFRAWAWIHMDADAIVYPKPAGQAQFAKAPGDPVSGTGQPNPHGNEGFAGFREYQRGDSTRRIAWKAFAKTGELLVTEPEDGIDPVVWIDWNSHAGLDTETRLSYMTRLVLDAASAGRTYGLRMADGDVGPGSGDPHMRACLTRLALFGAGRDD